MRVRKRKAQAAWAAGVALCVAAAAVAYLTTAGSGTGTAEVARVLPVTVDAGAAPSAPLSPGSDGDVTVHLSNPNGFAVHVGSLALDDTRGAGGFDATPAACDPVAAGLAFTTQTNGGDGWSVPAKAVGTEGRLDLDLPASIRMGADAPDACQGASFTVYLRAGP